MSTQSKKSLTYKIRRLVWGDPDRPLYVKIYAKTPLIAIVSAIALGISYSDAINSYRLVNRPERVRIAHIESYTRTASIAFGVLGAGVFGAYMLAVADRFAIARTQNAPNAESQSRNQIP